MGTKLHEILAVESSKEQVFKNTLSNVLTLFTKKTDHFWGHNKQLKLFGEETVEKTRQQEAESEYKELTTTLDTEFDYLKTMIGDYLDIMYQKDSANQNAFADIVVNGVTLATNVPATTLLGLENKLKGLRPVLENIPTLQPGTKWVEALDIGKGVYRDANSEVRTKTEKTFDFKILVQATDKHPAQVEKWTVDKPIGTYHKERWCSMLPVSEKSAMLARFDDLMEAIKQARCRANEVEITKGRISKDLLNFIFK